MDQVAALEQLLAAALRRIAALEAALATMAQENADLRRQLAKNSSNAAVKPTRTRIGLLAQPKSIRSVKRTAIMGHRNGCEIAQL
jgi:hypothetical protein